MTLETVGFWVVAVVLLASSLAVVLTPNLFHAVLYLAAALVAMTWLVAEAHLQRFAIARPEGSSSAPAAPPEPRRGSCCGKSNWRTWRQAWSSGTSSAKPTAVTARCRCSTSTRRWSACS